MSLIAAYQSSSSDDDDDDGGGAHDRAGVSQAVVKAPAANAPPRAVAAASDKLAAALAARATRDPRHTADTAKAWGLDPFGSGFRSTQYRRTLAPAERLDALVAACKDA